jgi:hypothetical protein
MVPPEVETSADKNAARFSDESFVLFFSECWRDYFTGR